jgi:hypothetical protein
MIPEESATCEYAAQIDGLGEWRLMPRCKPTALAVSFYTCCTIRCWTRDLAKISGSLIQGSLNRVTTWSLLMRPLGPRLIIHTPPPSQAISCTSMTGRP